MVIIVGCSWFTSSRPDTIDEAGAIRVSITSVAPWSEYQDAMQPRFSLDEEQALDQVVPTTRILDRRRLDAVGTRLKIAAPTTTYTKTKNELPSGAPAENPGISTTTQTSGDTSTLSLDSDPAGGRTAASLEVLKALEDAKLDDLDPMLRYWAATALYQEVQLINRYVKDAVRRDDFIPYVVRLQIGLMPLRRDLSYDAYINLSFFTYDKAARSVKCRSRTPDKDKEIPVVLPLLVTDNLEATLSSRTLNRLRSTALAFSAVLKGFGIGGDYSSIQEDLDRALGRDLNSLLMVSSLSDNTLRVRLGAYQMIDRKYAMVPRNFTVTAVVLVPKKTATNSNAAERRLRIYANKQMINVEDGEALGYKKHQKERDDVEKLIEFYELQKVTSKEIDFAWEAVLDNDWQRFNACIPTSEYSEQLWSDIAQLNTGYSVETLNLDLPRARDPVRFTNQTALLTDDKIKSTKAVVFGGAGLNRNEVCAALLLKDSTKSAVDYKLIASEIELEGGGVRGIFTFPSLRTLGLDSYTKDKDRTSLLLAHGEGCSAALQSYSLRGSITPGTRTKQETPYELNTRYITVDPPKPEPGFDLKVLSGVVVTSNEGRGSLKMVVAPSKENPATKAVISISGADIKSGTVTIEEGGKKTKSDLPEGLIGADFEVTLPKGGKSTIELQLYNLAEGKKVKIESRNERKISGSDKELPIQKALGS